MVQPVTPLLLLARAAPGSGPVGPISRPPVIWPALGASYYNSFTNPAIDLEAYAAMLKAEGMQFTRTFLLDAWAVGPNGTGQYSGFLPWLRNSAGQFDLAAWNPAYFARLRAHADALNAAGLWVQYDILELYTWSERKQGLIWVPDQELGPFRKNVNGVRWADDHTFDILPDDTLKGLMTRAVEALGPASYCLELGNEMPEKPMHARMRDHLRAIGYQGHITCSRNVDAPGQLDNMIGSGIVDRVCFHGRREIGYLDEVWEDEPHWKTFRQLFDAHAYPGAQVILCSDGCRKTTDVADAYDYPKLQEVALDGIARGFSYEHQLAMKLRMFTGTPQEIRLEDIAYDHAFLQALVAARRP